jgi:hypothetical protein
MEIFKHPKLRLNIDTYYDLMDQHLVNQRMENQAVNQLKRQNQLLRQYDDRLHELEVLNAQQNGIVKDSKIAGAQNITSSQTKDDQLIHYTQALAGWQ